MGYIIQTAPASEPVTTEEAKTHLHVDGTSEDEYIATLITAARQWVERYTSRGLITQTIKEYYDRFPPVGERLTLTVGVVASVTTVKYYLSTTLTDWTDINYIVDNTGDQANISEALNIIWPIPDYRANAVEIVYVVGSTAPDVPAAIKQAILLLVGSMYENREDTVRKVPGTIEFLLNPYRIWRF